MGKLPNNFHEIRTVFSEIDLSDELSFVLTNDDNVKILSNYDSLNNQENLIYKVAIFIKEKYRVKCGANLSLNKQIPIAAGLGGGSSNAAATIKGLSELWDLNFSEQEMHAIAANFGSDINFFLTGGTAIGSNRGEVIKPTQAIEIDNILLVNPGFGISSKEAYQSIVFGYMPKDFTDILRIPEPGYFFNRLEEGIRLNYPIIDEIIKEMENQNAQKAMLSGSGATVIGFFSDVDELKHSQITFQNRGYWTYKTKTIRSDE